MNTNHYPANNALISPFNPEKRILPTVIDRTEVTSTITALIRFEEKKERYIWAHPDEIIFVISADHYVKSLIKCGAENKWMTRHCTIKELLCILPPENFIRLNKFYLLNRNYFLRINENEKMLYLDDDFSVPVPHRISRFMLDMIKK